MKTPPFERITFALASEAPVGIISAAYSGQLSRLYSWNLETDEFLPGQFLKGRSQIFDVSPNGKLFAYYAETFHRETKSYIAISKPPYFTALAFFPTHHCLEREAEFESNTVLSILTCEPGWWGALASKEDSIIPGCLLEISRTGSIKPLCKQKAFDTFNNRELWSDGQNLYATDKDGETPVLLRRFERDSFEPIETPEWAKAW